MMMNHADAGAAAEPPDFTSLDGVVTIFQDPNNVFVGWIHYIAFDLLVARMICLDSVERQGGSSSTTWSLTCHVLIVVPCMFATIMIGPTGFLLYMILRQIFLPTSSLPSAKEKKYL
jgi:Domain of unknown function (DUF4281)